MSDRTGVLFVCLGNICRSPMAEGIFLHLAEARGVWGRFDVDSCGLGSWHVGERPDARALATAARHGIELPSIARKVHPRSDFDRFDLLLPMDLENRARLLEIGAPPSRVRLVRSFDPSLVGRPEGEMLVPDPYHGGDEGFERVFEMLERACAGLLDQLSIASR
ncbi:MAG: low molecular weight phosphotyrosine protein phosphatase [Phycisphaerales bacterium]|nr:low molecular weight phosphotyrosine protein phosphatase [Phycisphaerales bacterium]